MTINFKILKTIKKSAVTYRDNTFFLFHVKAISTKFEK